MRGRCVETSCKVIKVNPREINLVERFDAGSFRSFLQNRLDLGEFSFSLTSLRKLPHFLRQEKPFKGVFVKEEKGLVLADLLEEESPVYGLAIDLGSTTIAFYLYDFERDVVLEESSILNPQTKHGEDILTRLHLARKREKLEEITVETLEAINKEIERLNGERIYYVSLCGNTAMTHLLLGLPVNYLILEPYPPVAKWYGVFRSLEVEFKIHPEGRVFIFPSAGAYFGGDLIAGLFFVELYKEDAPSFFIDVGTNAEVVLGNRDFLLACAGAAGPALEGGIFSAGCRAEPGAIYKVSIDRARNQVYFETIGGHPPKCLCGSAIIDLMAQLFKEGVLSPEGRLIKESWKDRVIETDEGKAFLVYEDGQRRILIKEPEVKAFIRSKGAMFCILSLLCEKSGLSFEDVQKFYFAGSFGVNINVSSAVMLGMLPDSALDKAVAVGNSAGLGALKFLKHADFEEIKKIVDSITYLELNTEPRFMELLTGALFIPHVNLELFPRVKSLIERS
jgi:uncharacterized 2Fe-2S/4Fe-4S cluster protein (DUF4445 family)